MVAFFEVISWISFHVGSYCNSLLLFNKFIWTMFSFIWIKGLQVLQKSLLFFRNDWLGLLQFSVFCNQLQNILCFVNTLNELYVPCLKYSFSGTITLSNFLLSEKNNLPYTTFRNIRFFIMVRTVMIFQKTRANSCALVKRVTIDGNRAINLGSYIKMACVVDIKLFFHGLILL